MNLILLFNQLDLGNLIDFHSFFIGIIVHNNFNVRSFSY